MSKEVTINILNEVDITVVGLHGDHLNFFYKKYQESKLPSALYCKAKFAAIERSSENVQTVLGAKPR